MVFTLGLEKKRGQEIVENLILFLVKKSFCKKTIVIQKYIETICRRDNFVFKFNMSWENRQISPMECLKFVQILNEKNT